MNPERILLGAAVLALAYLGYEVRRISTEADTDRDLWYDAMHKWQKDNR